MKSRVDLEINAPQAELAALLADPGNNTRWMDDLERIEPVVGEPGQPGSTYQMVPAKGTMVFLATVLKRALPAEVQLLLRARRASVLVTDTFLKLSEGKTRLISEEEFTFMGPVQKLLGLFSRKSIARAHRRHMESFKRFAEGRLSHAVIGGCLTQYGTCPGTCQPC
jgi:hypothetical protein